MPSWWDYLHFNRQYSNKRNLEEGLFQIASQTCNILVKVNNTNNINLTRNNSRSDEYGCAGPPQGKSSMQICVPKFRKNSITSGCAPGLSTVLESGSVGNASSSDEELEQWEQIFMMRDENGNSYNDKRKKRSIWCRPSCIPVSIVIVLIVLVVLVPLLDQPNTVHVDSIAEAVSLQCSDQCRLSLVETIPEGQVYPPNTTHTPTKNVWLDLIDEAQTSIEIASLYWTLRKNHYFPNSSIQGDQVFQALYIAGTRRKINLRIAQSWPTKLSPNNDTEYLLKKKAAQVRSLNFSKLLGNGVLHTKFWLVDRKHFYIGSANMDWRSLTQVKELGIVAYNCSCLATDLGKIFDVYWSLGEPDAKIPDHWPEELNTQINLEHPINISDSTHHYGAYITSSPPPFNPVGRTNDDDAIVSIIDSAEEFVHISVMDYEPALVFTPKTSFWPKIDDAIRRAAIDNRVRVKMLISFWNHTHPADDHFLRSLASLSGSFPGVDIQVKRFIVPSTPDQARIPFARVNHNKYMVTDKTAYIGTSNWSGDYFTDTAGVAFVFQTESSNGIFQKDHTHGMFQNQTEHGNGTFQNQAVVDIRKELQEVFYRDWFSPYAVPLRML